MNIRTAFRPLSTLRLLAIRYRTAHHRRTVQGAIDGARIELARRYIERATVA